MIVVFVVDTSPSMGKPLKDPTLDMDSEPSSTSSSPSSSSSAASATKSPIGMSRLDLAKMTVESLTKMMERRVHDHNLKLQSGGGSKSLHNLGFGFSPNDQFLLLSTGCQHSTSQTNSAACGAGGRLLVGFGPRDANANGFTNHNGNGTGATVDQIQMQMQLNLHNQKGEFERELKRLKATQWEGVMSSSSSSSSSGPFPEDGGGAMGLNAALSTGLQLLSRHRLQNRRTENFGQGRLPSNSILVPQTAGDGGGGSGGNNVGGGGGGVGVGGIQQAAHALQPACLVLLTDGDCLRKLPSEGGGSLQLQFGKIPLREFYREPFRWDQRIFCLGVGPSGAKLHPSLRAFCDVTGGCYTPIRNVQDIPQVTNLMSSLMSPRLPSPWPIQNPLKLPHIKASATENEWNVGGAAFLNGGPVCAFQVMERNSAGQPGTMHRAMLCFIPCWTNDALKGNQKSNPPQPPIWCIPESYFPSKNMDNLPPRTAQPLLHYTRYYQAVGTCAFDPMKVMQMLHRLDHFIISNRSMSHGSQQVANKILQRDVYLCQWLSPEGRPSRGPSSQRGLEHFPIFVRGAGRSSLSDGEENVLNIGILHQPDDHKTPCTLTLLPPDPHILLPLLLKAAEMEHRQLKKASLAADGDSGKLLNASKNLIMDDGWRSEMRAYLFRVPPYYHFTLRRCLRSILPPSLHSLVISESVENSLSRMVVQKIRAGEQFSKAQNDRQEQSEGEFRRHVAETNQRFESTNLRYGQYDSRSPTHQYLNLLRYLPPPRKDDGESELKSKNRDLIPATSCLGDLPPECLLAFYESRRRWIFGGSGLTTKGLSIDGVPCNNNVHHYNAKRSIMDESLLSVVGVGASALNNTKISKMGDFKERLLFSNQPIIGRGVNDSLISPISTAPDGSPVWSLEDESLPAALFDQKTGLFLDSTQARIRARLMINFGNPFKSKQGDSIVPEEFASQRSPRTHKLEPTTPIGSPPHDPFSNHSEGEGEAEFAGLSPPRVDESDSVVGQKRLNPGTPESTKKPKVDPKEIPKTSSPQVRKPKPPPPRVAKPPPPKPQNKITTIKSNPKTQLQTGQRPPPPGPPMKHRPKPPQPSSSNPPSGVVNKQPAPKPPPPPVQNQSPNVKPKVNLPSNWISVWSKSKQKWYFFDKKTNNSVWEWPPPGGLR